MSNNCDPKQKVATLGNQEPEVSARVTSHTAMILANMSSSTSSEFVFIILFSMTLFVLTFFWLRYNTDTSYLGGQESIGNFASAFAMTTKNGHLVWAR